MKTLLMILQLLPAIIGAVKAAEELVPLPGQGKAKLDFILGVIADTGADVSAILPVITAIVARIVAPLGDVSYAFFERRVGRQIAKRVHYFLMAHASGEAHAADGEMVAVAWCALAEDTARSAEPEPPRQPRELGDADCDQLANGGYFAAGVRNLWRAIDKSDTAEIIIWQRYLIRAVASGLGAASRDEPRPSDIVREALESVGTNFTFDPNRGAAGRDEERGGTEAKRVPDAAASVGLTGPNSVTPSRDEPRPTQDDVLHDLWNGDIRLTAEQRAWIRQALDAQELGVAEATKQRMAAGRDEEPREAQNAEPVATGGAARAPAREVAGVASGHAHLGEPSAGPWYTKDSEDGWQVLWDDPKMRCRVTVGAIGLNEAEAIAVRDALNRVSRSTTPKEGL